MVPWVLSKCLLNTDPVSKKPVPVIDHPTSKKMLPNVQFIPLLVQLWIIPMHPLARSQQEGISISFLRDQWDLRQQWDHPSGRPHLLQSRQIQSSATLQRTGLPAPSPAWFPSLVVFMCLSTLLTAHSYSQEGHDNAEYSWTISSFDCLAVWDAPKGEGALLAARAHVGSYWACCQPAPWDVSLHGCSAVTSLLSKTSVLFQLQSPAFVLVMCPATGDCPMHQSRSLARLLALWESQLHLPVWCHQQNC